MGSDLESEIISCLSPYVPLWSNQLYRALRVNKANYTRARDKMIKEGWIKAEKRGTKIYLTLVAFEPSKYNREDWTKLTTSNCNRALKFLAFKKPIFKVTKTKKVKISNEGKLGLDMLLRELDRYLIIHARLVYAESLGLIRSRRGKLFQNECIGVFQKILNRLLSEHSEFKKEITEYAQSQIKTLQFMI